MAAGMSLTWECPQPNCLPWAMPPTRESGKRKELAQAALETWKKRRYACSGQVQVAGKCHSQRGVIMTVAEQYGPAPSAHEGRNEKVI